MDASYWHTKWEKNQIGFHESNGSFFLGKYFDELKLYSGARLFLPLCGKTKDIAWLLSKGYRVVGAELSEIAIGQLFDELGLEPVIEKSNRYTRYSGDGVDIFVGDVFELDAADIGIVDAIFDRAAFVALPADVRIRYSEHLRALSSSAKQLLVTLEYEQRLLVGPPFSIDEIEVRRCYENAYSIKMLESRDIEGGVKGKVEGTETAWLLSK